MSHEIPIQAFAVDPAGTFAAVCGITWTLLFPASGVAALVSAILCPFQRTACQALRLSRFGLWAGVVAVTVATVATIATAGFPKNPPEKVSDAIIIILMTGIAPVVSIFTGRISRAKIVKFQSR